MKKSFLMLTLALTLSGCVSFGEQSNSPGVVYYVLNDTAPTGASTPTPADALKDSDPLRAKERVESYAPQGDSDSLRAEARERSYAPTLLVLDTTTGSFYDSDQLVFSRSVGTRGQYQFARWTERPGKRFADLMRARLDHLGRYHVAAAGGYVRGDLMLDTRLVEFYHDATSEPGQVRLVLRADLVDLKQRTLLGRHTFEQQAPLTTYDAAGAAQASSQVVSRTLDDLTAWLATFK